MAHAWNACWVHALRGSNPLSSANGKAPDLDDRSGAFAVPPSVIVRMRSPPKGAGRSRMIDRYGPLAL